MTDLLEATRRLVAISSVSRDEQAIADHVVSELEGSSHLEVVRIANNVVARTTGSRTSRIALAGHLDTVPPSGNETPVVRGDVLHGIGAADMKGGLAVMLALAALEETACEMSVIFYACEEIERSQSGLLALEAARPDLLEADAAVLLEPTSARLEAGCQGVIKAEVTVRGERAHVARPWVGINAIHRLAPVLERLVAFGDHRPVVEGCTYRESLQAVTVRGGHASNVVPDEASAVVVYRFAPDKSVDDADAVLRAHLEGVLDPSLGDGIELLDAAPAARPGLEHPFVAALAAKSAKEPLAKLGWTDVAFFSGRNVPAVNYGPGDALVAHHASEHVRRDELESAYATLAELLMEGWPDPNGRRTR